MGLVDRTVFTAAEVLPKLKYADECAPLVREAFELSKRTLSLLGESPSVATYSLRSGVTEHASLARTIECIDSAAQSHAPRTFNVLKTTGEPGECGAGNVAKLSRFVEDSPVGRILSNHESQILKLCSQRQDGYHFGTEFIVQGGDGMIATANHVVRNAIDDIVRVNMFGRTDFPVMARVLARDVPNDVAILKAFKRAPGTPANFKDFFAGIPNNSELAAGGRTGISFGFPKNDLHVAVGDIAGAPLGADVMCGTNIRNGVRGCEGRVLEVKAPVFRGMSGGPTFDEGGHLLGVNSFTSKNMFGIPDRLYSAHIKYVNELIKSCNISML